MNKNQTHSHRSLDFQFWIEATLCSLSGTMAIHSGMEDLLINHTRLSHCNHHLCHCLLRYCREKTFFWWMTVKVHLQLLVVANEMLGSVCDWYRPWRHMGTSGPFLCSATMRLWHHVEHWKWNEMPSCIRSSAQSLGYRGERIRRARTDGRVGALSSRWTLAPSR